MDAGMYEAGMQVRREVLGNDYVDQAVRSTDDFNRPFQELITEFCWGACWTRPGLERRTRSMLNLAMLTALGRSHELKLHLRGALRNGVSREEIREVLIQASIYAGIPAGVEAFRCAREVLAEADKNAPEKD